MLWTLLVSGSLPAQFLMLRLFFGYCHGPWSFFVVVIVVIVVAIVIVIVVVIVVIVVAIVIVVIVIGVVMVHGHCLSLLGHCYGRHSY